MWLINCLMVGWLYGWVAIWLVVGWLVRSLASVVGFGCANSQEIDWLLKT